MTIKNMNTKTSSNLHNTTFKDITISTMDVEKTSNTKSPQNLKEQNVTIFNTIAKNIFNMPAGRNLFSRAENHTTCILRMIPMQIFTYLPGKISSMSVIPNNMKGNTMKFKINILRALTIVSLYLLTVQTFAESASVNPSVTPSVNTAWQPYVGASAGYARMAAKNHWSEKAVGGAVLAGKNNFNSKGFIGTLYVGMQRNINSKIRVGAELYGFLESNKASASTSVVVVNRVESLKKENGGGIKAKAGYLFDTHTSVYAHVGVEKAGLKYTVSQGGPVGTAKKYLWGIPFGLGVETSLGSSWAARVEYTHVIYQKWTTSAKPVDSFGTTSKTKISPSQDTIVLGVSYAF